MEWFIDLNGVWQAFLCSLFTWGMTALGAATVFFSGKSSGRFLPAVTGAAAGIMISASFFSLLLPAIRSDGTAPWLAATVGFILGGAFILGSDLFFAKLFGGKEESKRKGALLYAAVTAHNIPEGMAFGVAFGAALGTRSAVFSALALAVGIGIQNFPEGICVAYPLKTQGCGNFKAFFFSQASGAAEIPAAIFGAAAAYFARAILPWTLSFAAGCMIAVVCSELIPDCFRERKTLPALGVIFGFALMMFLDLFLS